MHDADIRSSERSGVDEQIKNDPTKFAKYYMDSSMRREMDYTVNFSEADRLRNNPNDDRACAPISSHIRTAIFFNDFRCGVTARFNGKSTVGCFGKLYSKLLVYTMSVVCLFGYSNQWKEVYKQSC